MSSRVANRTTLEKCMAAELKAKSDEQRKRKMALAAKQRVADSIKAVKGAKEIQKRMLDWLPSFAEDVANGTGRLGKIREFEFICRTSGFLKSSYTQTDLKRWLLAVGYGPTRTNSEYVLKSMRHQNIHTISPKKKEVKHHTSKPIEDVFYEEHILEFDHQQIKNKTLNKVVERGKSSMVDCRGVFGLESRMKVVPTPLCGNQYYLYYEDRTPQQNFMLVFNVTGTFINHAFL